MIGLCDLCLFGAARALRAPARGTGRGTTAALYVPILSIPIGHRSGMYRVSAIYLTSLVADFAWTGGDRVCTPSFAHCVHVVLFVFRELELPYRL